MRCVAAWSWLWLALAWPLLAFAQQPGPPTFHDLLATWAQGDFRAPLSCELDGELVRGVRRVSIYRDPDQGRRNELIVRFVDIKADAATRCVDDTGRDLPNILGKVVLRHPARPHPETAMRDFKRNLKRDRGFDLQIVRGSLKIEPVGMLSRSSKIVDFRGGKASISLIFPATDPERALAPFRSQRKLLLSLVADSGEEFLLPLFDPSSI